MTLVLSPPTLGPSEASIILLAATWRAHIDLPANPSRTLWLTQLGWTYRRTDALKTVSLSPLGPGRKGRFMERGGARRHYLLVRRIVQHDASSRGPAGWGEDSTRGDTIVQFRDLPSTFQGVLRVRGGGLFAVDLRGQVVSSGLTAAASTGSSSSAAPPRLRLSRRPLQGAGGHEVQEGLGSSATDDHHTPEVQEGLGPSATDDPHLRRDHRPLTARGLVPTWSRHGYGKTHRETLAKTPS